MSFKEDKSLVLISFLVVVISISSMLFIFFNIGNSNKNTQQKSNNTKKLSFVGVGDNLIHDTIYIPADARDGYLGDGKYDFDSFYKNIKDNISKYDIRYINQESIVAGNQFGISSYPKFNSPEALINSVIDAGFNLINLANNHSFDRGEAGIINSLKLWDKTNVHHIGIYDSEERRNKPYIIEKNGIRVGILSYTYGTNGMFPSNDYMIPYLDEEKIKSDFQRIKPLSDFLLVSVHWGEEGVEDLDNNQIKYSKLFSDLGADVVLGTHAHRIQKVEWLKNKNGKETLIYYGTGNFVHNMISAKTYLEGMASFEFVKDGNKKYINNAKFTPLVFHLERGSSGYEGSVYRMDEYTVDLANKHIEMFQNGKYHLDIYRETLNRLIPTEMLDMRK